MRDCVREGAAARTRVTNGPAMTWLGGQFDPAKLDWYRTEMRERIALARQLPMVFAHLLRTMTPASVTPVPVA